MCSFLVYAALLGKKVNLKEVNYYLQKRGPDLTKEVQYKDHVFVHNLLNITGPITPQPFVDEDNQIVILYNGEIYNYLEFGEYNSDGECLLPLYKEYGEQFITKLDGEFAIVIFDYGKNKIILTTDVFGTKPLWYQIKNGEIVISSYASAIFKIGYNVPVQLTANTTLILRLHDKLLLKKLPVYTFDLTQNKRNIENCVLAFEKAIEKRTKNLKHPIFICLSSGYDSGMIVCALNKLKINYKSYTVPFDENQKILRERYKINEKNGNPSVVLEISKQMYKKDRIFMREITEPSTVTCNKTKEKYTVIDDWAAVGLTSIFKQASNDNPSRRIYLSGQGGDEIFGDYGFRGEKFKACSQLAGVFPRNLSGVFPWNNFYEGRMKFFLAKEEYVAGSLGIESRYPFLDRDFVQEYLWLLPKIKNRIYKAPMHHYMTTCKYPFDIEKKKGFKVIYRLVREEIIAEIEAEKKGKKNGKKPPPPVKKNNPSHQNQNQSTKEYPQPLEPLNSVRSINEILIYVECSKNNPRNIIDEGSEAQSKEKTDQNTKTSQETSSETCPKTSTTETASETCPRACTETGPEDITETCPKTRETCPTETYATSETNPEANNQGTGDQV